MLTDAVAKRIFSGGSSTTISSLITIYHAEKVVRHIGYRESKRSTIIRVSKISCVKSALNVTSSSFCSCLYSSEQLREVHISEAMAHQ